MKKLTKKQVYEFSRIYIGSYLVDTNKKHLHDLECRFGLDEDTLERIAEQIDIQGTRILGKRKKCLTVQEILDTI